MSLPKEPRQLMINLMYLVLTALLAMNVSKEVINAFTVVDQSIDQSNDNIDNKNDATMENFDLAKNDNELEAKKRDKVAKAMVIADEARAKTKEMIAKLEAHRQAIIELSGGMAVNSDGKMRIKREDDLESATSYMITNKNGDKMKSELEAHKKTMADFIDNLPDGLKLSQNAKMFAEKLPINFETENKDKTWSQNMFEMTPAVAAVTIINKYKNDVKNAESAVLDELWASAMGEKKQQKIVPDLVFNKYGVIANLDNSYALPGQTLNLTSMLGAYNADAQGLKIFINGSQVSAKDGIAKTSIKASSTPGQHTIKISAQYLDKGTNEDEVNTWKSVPDYTVTYFVGQPQASISLDKMMVLYKGLDNPMTVAASGVPLNDLTVTPGPNLNLVKTGPGKYKAIVSKDFGTTYVTVTGKRSDGSTENFGKYTYRLDRLPDPLAEVGGQKGGTVLSAGGMSGQAGVFAKLRGFPYDVEYKIVSYTLIHQPKKGEMPAPAPQVGPYLNHPKASSGVRAIMNNLSVGDRLFFEEIKAVGPDNVVRSLNGLTFRFTK